MPADVFAALAALVRAEARRNAPRSEPRPPAATAPTDPSPSLAPSTSQDLSTPQDPSVSVPAQPATPPARPDDPAAAPEPPPAAPAPDGGRPCLGLLRRLRALVAAVVRRRRLRSADRGPAPENS